MRRKLMRFGSVPYGRLLLWMVVFLFSCLLPVQAQLHLKPTLPPIALTQNWQYYSEADLSVQGQPPSLQEKQWADLNIPQRFNAEDSPIVWLAIPLPTGNWRSPTLYFRGIPQILEAYLNDEVIYTRQQLNNQEQLLHNEGAFPLVTIAPESNQEQTLLIRLYTAHNSVLYLGYGGVPKLGEKSDLVRELVIQDSPRLVLGFLFIFCGVFPLILVLFRNTEATYLSFGCVAFLIGIYTITPTQIVRLLFHYSVLWTYVHHIAFHLLPVSIAIFFEHIFGVGPRKVVRYLWRTHLVYAPLAILLAGSQILSWKQVALPTQLGGLVTASILISIAAAIAHKGNPEAKIFTLGFALFLIFTVYDLIVYLVPQLLWSFQLYTWGMLAFLICLVFILERRFREAQNHLKAYNKASDRFVPHEFLTLLGKSSIIDVRLGDQVQQEMTVLFSDIRSFTSLSESMTPERNFNFLNLYLDCVSPVIRQHHGFIDKYIGDAVMALFPHTPQDAIEAAIAMQQQLAQFNQRIIHEGYPAINIGIGLHHGSLMLGTLGEAQRMETTVIADAVNLASRLEECTKQYGAALIISQRTLNTLPNPEQFDHRFLGNIFVKGKKEAIEICEIYTADPAPLRKFKTQTREQFETGIHHYDRGETAAAQAIFEQLWEANPDDTVVRLCLLRCKAI